MEKRKLIELKKLLENFSFISRNNRSIIKLIGEVEYEIQETENLIEESIRADCEQ